MAELSVYGSAFLLAFAGGCGAAFAAWRFIAAPPVAAPSVATPRQSLPPYVAGDDSQILRDPSLSTLSFYNLLLKRLRIVQRLGDLIEKADVSWSVGRISAMMLLIGIVVLNVGLRFDFMPVVVAIVLALGGASLPLFYLISRRDRRYRDIEQQLPEALDYLSRALVAGHSLPMSLELLADEAGPPLSTELRQVVDEYNLGMSMDDALRGLALRLPVVDVQFLVSAVLTQSRTGGNLHEVLENLSETIRERFALKGQVRALTANGRMSAIVLSLLPIFIGTFMWMFNPTYFNILIGNRLGTILIACAVFGQILAYLVISKIVDIKV